MPDMPEEKPLDAVTIGNAIVDIIARADDAFISEQGMTKSAMNLIDSERSSSLYDAIGPAMEVSGGSAANTAAGIASLGGSAGYIGKISSDMLGRVFSHDIRAAGVRFDTPPLENGPATACSIILVTPDSQRTMNTYLGACINLVPEDIDPVLISQARYVYLEGYLFDAPNGPACFARAAEAARDSATKVALSLSDAWCVERHHEALSGFIANHTDLLIGNAAEMEALVGADGETGLRRLGELVEEAVITSGAAGSTSIGADGSHHVDADSSVTVIDTTGAGDLYAAGYLFGRSRGMQRAEAAAIGTMAATEIISHIGARPQQPLDKMLAAMANGQLSDGRWSDDR